MHPGSHIIYKIVSRTEWKEALKHGVFEGSPVDIEDGYIHFSTADQVRETASKHFRGKSDLLLLFVDDNALGTALRREPSRGGDLFPHLYAPLDVSSVLNSLPLEPDENGNHVFPEQL